MNVNIHELVKKVPAKGVLHVGANTCQELELYKSLGFKDRVWVEPNKQLEFPKGEFIRHVAISDICGTRPFYYASNNGESSSLLTPNLHKEKYKNIGFTKGSDTIVVYTLEHILSEQSINMKNLNYLVLDIQGAELKALKGLGMFQNHFEVIITEAYLDELYNGCGKLHEIEAYLSNYKLVEFKEESGKGWGDAAFIRKDLL